MGLFGRKKSLKEENFELDGDYDEDYDDSEKLSVGDAADIWLSNGKDEDYMFGYTEEELEDSLWWILTVRL